MVREKDAACWMEETAVSMPKQEVIPGGWKIKKEASITLFNTPWRSKKIFLVDGIVSGRPTASSVILAVLRG